MKSTVILIFSSFLIASGALAQDTGTSDWLNEVWLQTGAQHQAVGIGTLQDFRKLAPQSRLLQRNLDGFSYSNQRGRESMSFGSISTTIPLRKSGSTGMHSQFRVGVSYLSGINLVGAVFNNNSFTIDTLTSTVTGQTFYLDSIQSDHYLMEYSTDNLLLDFAWINRTNPESRWSFYAGIGVTAGLSFNANTEIFHTRREEVRVGELDFTDQTPGFLSDTYTSDSEYFRNKSGFAGSVYAPIGVDFRVGKNSEFWKRAHLFAEIRPGFNITAIPELTTRTAMTLTASLGLRISLN